MLMHFVSGLIHPKIPITITIKDGLKIFTMEGKNESTDSKFRSWFSHGCSHI